MEQSLFIDEVKKYFPGIAARVIARLNDVTNPATPSYLHRQMLRKKLSTNMKWESLSVNGTIVAADVIAMDSSIPLKKRDSIARGSGDIPKLGLELALRERELTDLDYLAQQTGMQQEFLSRLFSDTGKVIQGPYETLEYMFLLGLSSGITVIADTNNVGAGIRIDYGYLAANSFGVPVLWSNTASTPLSDISNRMIDKATADGNSINLILIDKLTFNRISATAEARNMYANGSGFFGASAPVPTLAQLNQAAQDRYGFVFKIIDRTVRFEKNGVQTSLKPWTVGSVIGLASNQVGTLTYGTLAEMNHPVAGVNYTTVDDFILVSKFRMNRPSLAEFTNSQALVLPVIDGVDAIYKMDSTTVVA